MKKINRRDFLKLAIGPDEKSMKVFPPLPSAPTFGLYFILWYFYVVLIPFKRWQSNVKSRPSNHQEDQIF